MRRSEQTPATSTCDLTPPVNFRDGGLYHSGNGHEAPFEVLLRRSTQKIILAQRLAERLDNIGGEELSILDIGSSKGTLIAMFTGELTRRQFEKPIRFSLVEPDPSSVRSLRFYTDAIRDISRGKFVSDVFQTGWEEFQPGKYDAIICSHVIYHFDPKRYPELFSKMVSSLKPNARLFISAREREGNEVFELIQRYKLLASSESFNQITIEDAVPALQAIAEESHLRMDQEVLRAQLTLPFKSNASEARALVAFILQRPSWNALPRLVREGVENDYGHEDTIVVQTDRLIEIDQAPTI